MANEDETVQDVLQQLQSSGKQAELEAMLKQRLESSEWIDGLRARCNAFLRQRGADNVTIEEVVHKIAPEGRSTVPGSVKGEILAELKQFVQDASTSS